MPELYKIGQTLTIMLVAVSLFYLAINTLSIPHVEGGLVGGNPTFTGIANDLNVLEANFTVLRSELEEANISVVGVILIPFEFIGVAVSAALLVAKLAFLLLTGWTEVVRLLFEPFDLCCDVGSLGFVLIGVFGAIQLFFIFRYVIIVASVIRGGGGGGG